MLEEEWCQEIREEERGINIKNEGSLHNQIKHWYGKKGDRFEVKVGGYIIDIVRNNQLIEIQTGNFGAIKNKIKALLKENYPVRLVYPICKEKWIITVEKDGEMISKRKSPKKGDFLNVFDELLRCPELMNEQKFSLEVLLINAQEIRCKDGKGSWRRRGLSIIDRYLLDVIESKIFINKEELISFLPKDLPQPFTNKMLSHHLSINNSKATKITYCLKKMNCIETIGKKGNAILYTIKPSIT